MSSQRTGFPVRKHGFLTTVASSCYTSAIIAILTTLPFILFGFALYVGRAAAVKHADAEACGSLRRYSLRIYGAAEQAGGNNATGPRIETLLPVFTSMQATRRSLQTRYPVEVEAGAAVWERFSRAFSQSGRVDWATADSMCSAADRVSRAAQAAAVREHRTAEWLLVAGLVFSAASSLLALLLNRLGFRHKQARRSAEERIRCERAFLRSVLDSDPNIVFVKNADGRFVFVNAAMAHAYGTTAEEMEGKSDADFNSNAEEVKAFLDADRRLLATGQEIRVEETITTGSGEARWFTTVKRPIMSPDGRERCVLGVSVDVTSRKQTEETLRASEKRMIDVVENLPTGAVYVEGETVKMNRAVEEITGYSRDDVPTVAAWFTALYGDRSEEMRAAYEVGKAGGFAEVRARSITRKDGQVRFVEFVSYAWETGEVWLINDVTDHVNAQEGQALLSAIIEESPDYVGIIKPDRQVVYRNKAFRDLCGLSEQNESDAGCISAVDPTAFGQVYPAWALERVDHEAIPAAIAYGHWQGEAALLRADGTEVPISMVVIAHKDKQGNVRRLSAVCRDISLEKRTQEELRASDAQLNLALSKLSLHVQHSPLAFIETDAQGRFAAWSPAATRIFGWREEEVLGKLPTDIPFMHENDMARLGDALPRLLDGSLLSYESSHRNYTKDGRTVQCRWFNLALTEPDGTLIALQSLVLDDTDRLRAEEAIRESQANLQRAQALAHVGSWEGQWGSAEMSWSTEMCRMFGLEPTLSVTMDVLFGIIHPDDRDAVRRRCTGIVESLGSADIEHRIVLPSGEVRYIHTRFAANDEAQDTGGGDHGILLHGTVLDITDRKRAEELIRQSRQNLNYAQAMAHVGSWRRDIRSGEVEWSDELFRIFGLTETHVPPAFPDWLVYVDSQDRGRIRRLFEDAMTRGEAFDTETRLCGADGVLRHVHTRCEVFRDPEGHPDYIRGTMSDITERVNALREQAKFVSLIENCGDFIAMTSWDGRLLAMNPAARRLAGITETNEMDNIDEMTLAAFMPEADWERVQREILPTVQQQGRWEGDLQLRNIRSSEMRYMRAGFFVIRDPSSGEPMCVATVQRDVTDENSLNEQFMNSMVIVQDQIVQLEANQIEIATANLRLEKANKRLEALATTDGLTGLKNHRAFQDELAREFKRSQRSLSSFSVVILDVDEFKKYNDAFGHPEGDKVLKELAKTLQDTVRGCDFVARYGGEEFVVLLPETGVAGAKEAAERMRKALEAQSWEKRPVTASFGVATLTSETPTTAELVDAADKALYASKKGGRNRVTHADEMPVAPIAVSLESDIAAAVADLGWEMQQNVERLKSQEWMLAAGDLEETLLGAYDATVTGWSRLLHMKDKETDGHSERVTEMTTRLARRIGMNERQVTYARWGALLHDIGKVGVPDSILLKPGSLTAEEWIVMKTHPVIADRMLSSIDFLKNALDIPRGHHEKWDGSGYPLGLKGDDIPLAARLFAVVDVWDALRSDRPYRKAWDAQRVREYLRDSAGSHFDERAVKAFLEMIDEDGEPDGQSQMENEAAA